MKEISIEEKAKAYDGNYKAYTELINRLEDVKNAIKKQNYGIAMDILCKPYPEFKITTSTELKESEDERTWIINYLSNRKINSSIIAEKKNLKKAIAWLEKQGEQMSDPRYKYLKELLTADDIYQMSMNDAMVEEAKNKAIKALSKLEISNLLEIEKHGEKNPADNVEPKFKVGDFIANDYCRGKVVELTNDAYLLDTGQGIPFSCEHNIHLWTIQNAMDGDVLVTHSGIVFIFKNIMEGGTISFHAALSTPNFASNTKIHIPEDNEQLGDQEVFPATKEQREQLEKAMADAGWEFDFDKKELKKIEQTSAWSEEDKNFIYDTLSNLTELKDRYGAGYGNVGKCIDWLKSLRPQPKQEILEKLEEWLDEYVSNLADVDTASLIGSFTNYLDGKLPVKPKNTWKPSESDILLLERIANGKSDPRDFQASLQSIIEQLKKLREE